MVKLFQETKFFQAVNILVIEFFKAVKIFSSGKVFLSIKNLFGGKFFQMANSFEVVKLFSSGKFF